MEQQLAAQVGTYTPTVLRDWGAQLLNLLDQDGARPDERDPREGNELRLARDPHGGGWVKGRFTDAAMYDQIAALIDAKSAPLTADDHRPLEQRQAEAMAEIFGWVAAHGDTTAAPTTGGRRPQVNVLIGLEDLQNRATPPASPSAAPCTRPSCAGCAATPGSSRSCWRGRAAVGRGPPSPHRPGRDAPGGHRPRPRLRPPRVHPPTILVRNPPYPRMGTRRRHGLSNLVMLCSTHHREIHSSGWSVRIAPDGLPEFIPPCGSTPSRNPAEIRPHLETGRRPTTPTHMTHSRQRAAGSGAAPSAYRHVLVRQPRRCPAVAVHMIGVAAIDPRDALRCERLIHRWGQHPAATSRGDA